MPQSPPVDAGLLQRLCAPTRWTTTDWVETVGSTNTELAALARAGAPLNQILGAEHQRTGKGRLGRQWESPIGATISLSVLTRPTAPIGHWTWLPLITGMAVAEALTDAGVNDVNVKWPNDVLVGPAKICGILAELVDTPTGPAVVIGLGLNVSLSVDELPVPTATSLILQGNSTPKTELVARILTRLDVQLAELDAGHDLVDAFSQWCSTLGQTVQVEGIDADPVVGLAHNVDAQGRLGVRIDGQTRWFAAGDVHHLRKDTA